MAHFKLDPSYLTQRVDSVLNGQLDIRDVKPVVARKIFLSEVLHVMIHHVDQEHRMIRELIAEHQWLDSRRIVKGTGGKPGVSYTQILYQGAEEKDLKYAVECLVKAPLRLTLVLADVVRLYRCFLITEYLQIERPEYYILGKCLRNFNSNSVDKNREGVQRVDIEKFMAKIESDETKTQTNLEEEIMAWCNNPFP
jgi:hypothetical protein